MFIYVLELEKNRYYVGITKRADNSRILEHFSKNGTRWTTLYKPIKVISVQKQLSVLDEDNKTKELMFKYGIDNVRGGSYSMVKLSSDQKLLLYREKCTAYNLCFRCGIAGHQRRNCKTVQCYKCKGIGHYANNCPGIICYKCKKRGHYANRCPDIKCKKFGKMGHSQSVCNNSVCIIS